ncbi:MAG: argininosuccinate lyase [Flavobacteriaceae bacterium]|nr:argininosuccinate lyase [Flavobacteriaceae bacterium]|tara:strand:- start:16815 stop:18101 length:1287 start_codon:yes stop_codon:yes gene_type:complete
MKLWDKGLKIDRIIENFTVGNDREIDTYIAKYDVQASLAHAEMLCSCGYLTKPEFEQLKKGLQTLQTQIENDTFQIEKSFEDVHSKIEFELTKVYGEVGKKIHTARSRNDQVLVALHLYYKDSILEIKRLLKQLFDSLIKLADNHQGKLLPGYTHLQVAMPSSFGMWFSSYAELLIDDMVVLNSALKVVDQNPLGSAAGYGSSFKIDREETTKLLNFNTLKYNSVAAQLSRGKSARTIANALGSVGFTLSKFAMDVCLYISQNFGFITFPNELTTGSSIMPHKKNPDVFELLRASSNKVQALSSEIQMITNNLPSGYHRDFQLLKEPMINGIEKTKEILSIFDYAIQQIIIQPIDFKDDKYKYLSSVDSVNALVQEGKSFREAYQIVGKEIEEGTYAFSDSATHTHEGSIHNLSLDKIIAKMEDLGSL